jgi:enoyl-CoA hydratase/carnithine racemase
MSVRVHRLGSVPGVAVVVIDSPKTVNAITRAMLLALAKAFRELRVDRSVKCVVLTATGRRAFSTGIDLRDAERVFKMDESRVDDDIVHQMELCPFPIVGAINGVAINAGFELALACDVLLASPRASFRDTHAAFGILPSWGLSQKLARIVGANVARMTSLAASPLAATDAHRCGLVNLVVHEADDAHDLSDVDADLHTMMATRGGAAEGGEGGEGGGGGGVVVAGGNAGNGSSAGRGTSRSPGAVPNDLPGDLAPNLVGAALDVAARIAAMPRAGVAGYKRVMRDGLAVTYAEGRAEERRRAFEQYRALPESFFQSMGRKAGLKPRARL